MALERGECLLRGIRQQAGLTQEDLSYKLYKDFDLEISAQMISHYETGYRFMSPIVNRAMAVIFHRVMDDFYTWPHTKG